MVSPQSRRWAWKRFLLGPPIKATLALAASLLLVSAPLSPAGAEGEEQEVTDPGEDSTQTKGGATNDSNAITVEGLVLVRSNLEDLSFTGRGSTANAPFITFSETELSGSKVTPGIRGTLRGELFDQRVEFSAFYMSPIELERTKDKLGSEAGNPADTNAPFHPENNPGADISSPNSENIYALTAHLSTKLFGGEVNAVSPLGIPGLMLGARAIYFGEALGVTTMDTTNDFPGLGTGTARDQVNVRTDNRLFGLQAGLEGMIDLGSALRVGGSIKGGLYDNVVTRERTFQSLNQSVRRQDLSDRGDVFAQGVEVNPRVELRLSKEVLLSAAGTFLWLNNVSTAMPHYASVTDRDDHGLRADKDVYFYGGSLGLTFMLDNAAAAAGGRAPLLIDPRSFGPGATLTEIEERIADLEATSMKKGNPNLALEISGWMNRAIMAWNDGAEANAYVVENTAARTRVEFRGSAKIARGWGVGYLMSLGFDDAAANDVDQLNDNGESQIEVRHSAWWVRSNLLGTATVGLTSTATDDIILNDVGGIMPGAANIATIGGSLIVRHADEYETGDAALIPRTTLDDFAAGGSVDTLRRKVIRYDAPRLQVLGGSVDLSTAWGEDDFVDVGAWYRLTWNDWKVRGGVGYVHDTDEGIRTGIGTRDREEIKGSWSVLHIPSGLFATVAFVHRDFDGHDPSDQAVFGENTTGIVTPVGSNRPPIEYLYTAWGVRKSYSDIGDTTFYGEWAVVDDAITGLNEAGLGEVTDSKLQMIGAAICQNIDEAAMDLYAGFRFFTFDTEGVSRFAGNVRDNPTPLTDISIAYTGARIKF